MRRLRVAVVVFASVTACGGAGGGASEGSTDADTSAAASATAATDQGGTTPGTSPSDPTADSGSDGNTDGGNQPPSVDAGADQAIVLPSAMARFTADVADPDGTIVSVAWSQQSGPPATLLDADTTTLTARELAAGDYVFRITATDDLGAQASDDVALTVSTCDTCTTYFIDPDGDDAADGSQANPWRTLAHATSVVSTPGDIIHVDAGTYVETETSHLAVGVSIEGEGPSSVISSTITADFAPIIDAGSPEGTDGNQSISAIAMDGGHDNGAATSGTWWAISITGRSNVRVFDTTISNFLDRGVSFNGRSDYSGEPPTTYATGNSFYRNTLTNSARYTDYGTGCLNVGGQIGLLVHDNTITQVDRPWGQNGWPIKAASEGYLQGVKIYDNVLTKIPFGGDAGGDGGWDFALEFFNVSGMEVYRNTIQGAFDTNFQTKGDYDYSVWIHHNTFVHETLNPKVESGVILEFSTDAAIVEDNVFHNFTTGILFTPREGDVISDVTVRRNLFDGLGQATGADGNPGSMLITLGTVGTFTTHDLFIHNNTCVTAPGNSPFWGIQLSNSGSTSHVEIRNNILQGFVAGAIVAGPSDVLDDISIENNILHGNGNDNAPVWSSGEPTNLTVAGNLDVDPMFVGGGDFTLQAGSPAIDAGLDVGQPFAGVAPDIGYAERR